MKIITQRFFVRFFAIILLLAGNAMWSQIYYHDFGTADISGNPYTAAPSTLAAGLSNSYWTTSTGSFTSYTGASGKAIAISNSSGTPAITLSFDVEAGKQLSVTSFNFWRRSSATGATNWSLLINGTAVGSGTTSISGSNIGQTSVANPVEGLTGTVSVVISLSGASGTGTFRLDDFTLNGTVTDVPGLGAPVATAATDVTTAGFTANWNAVAGATAYYLDVSTDAAFINILPDYNNLVVYGFSQYVSEGIQPDMAYYYRVRAASDTQVSENSNNIQAVIPACGTIALPEAAANQVFCGTTTVSQLQATGTGTIQWYALEVNGTPLQATDMITSGIYYASQVVANCESERVSVIVTVNDIPDMPETLEEQVFCGSGTVAELQIASGTNPKWYLNETGGEALTPETPLVTGNYYVSQTVNGCESPRGISEVTINTVPDAPAAAAQTVCFYATVADLTVTTGEMPQWYTADTGGDALAADT